MVVMHLAIKKQTSVLFVKNLQHTKLAIMDSAISIGKKPLDGKASDKKEVTNATKEYILKISQNREWNHSLFAMLYQICMILYCLFDPLWLNTDIPLCGTGTAVL